MERLIYSSSLSTKFHLKPYPYLPQLARINSPRVNSPFPYKRPRFRLQASCFTNPIEGISVNTPPDSSISRGSSSPSLVNANLQKAFAVGKLILLTSLTITIITAPLPPPAFASFTATNTGGAAGLLHNNGLLSSAWTGFFAGCLHTLSGPDHLAALAPLSIGRTRIESAIVGALWGCGHDAGQLIFGLLFLLLKDRLHIEIIRTWGTVVVGLTLLIIGVMGVKEAYEVSSPTPCVVLDNGGGDVGVYETSGLPLAGKKKKIGFATFATGIVHGLQPDALMIILPALALPSKLAGAAFLGMFLVGTVVAMSGYAMFIGSFTEALKDRIPRITEKLTWVSSFVAIGLGLAIIISQYFGLSLY